MPCQNFLAKTVKFKNAMPLPIVVAVLELGLQQVQKLELLFAWQRFDVLVVDVPCT